MLTETFVSDPDLYIPGRTVPSEQRPTSAVRISAVTYPSAKGAMWAPLIDDGAISTYWCCVPGSPRGPVTFADLSGSMEYWEDLLPGGDRYNENDTGSPVSTTWYGARGRDKQK